eukprot:SAG31_NODE_2148_length_6333_cov_16.166667_3_plen_113_part_00
MEASAPNLLPTSQFAFMALMSSSLNNRLRLAHISALRVRVCQSHLSIAHVSLPVTLMQLDGRTVSAPDIRSVVLTVMSKQFSSNVATRNTAGAPERSGVYIDENCRHGKEQG